MNRVLAVIAAGLLLALVADRVPEIQLAGVSIGTVLQLTGGSVALVAGAYLLWATFMQGEAE